MTTKNESNKNRGKTVPTYSPESHHLPPIESVLPMPKVKPPKQEKK
jgi:hypothetical protein